MLWEVEINVTLFWKLKDKNVTVWVVRVKQTDIKKKNETHSLICQHFEQVDVQSTR